MNEIILLLLAIVSIFSVACSVALIALGKIIDDFPMGDEETRTRSITSPIESTKISVILFWALFIPGAWAVLQEGIFTRIVGITTLFSICLFMFTALIFSFAVLSAMRGKRHEMEERAHHIDTPAPVTTASPRVMSQEPVVGFKRRRNPLSTLMINALPKK